MSKGGLTFYVDPGGWPSGWYGAAVADMQTVVNEYNAYGDFTANNPGNIYVYYNAGIPTEQASYGGWGGSVGVGNTYPNVRVLLHESSHWLGTGTYSNYWSGPAASALMQEFDGIGNLLNGDSQHYWPYGENYDNESSPINDARHVAMVYALREDFGIGSTAAPSSATNVTMTASDTAGTSGFNFPFNWSDGHFPQAGTNYSTGNFLMLSPLDENSSGPTPSFNFAGAALTVNNTNGNKGGLQFQGTGTSSVLGFNNLILDGGYIGATNGSGNLLQLGGKITLASTGTIDAAQGNINIPATITGTGSVNINGSGYSVTLSSGNSFTGGISINNGATLYANPGNGANNKALSYASAITVNNGGTLESGQNGLFGSDGTTERPIIVNAGGTLIADAGVDVGVGTVTLNGGTLANSGPSTANGSWRFDNATDRLVVTDNSTVSAVNVKFGNANAGINVSSGKTLNFTGTITDATSGGISYLNVIGAGTVSLGNTSTYSGTTFVQGGKLLLSGSSSINNTSSISITGGRLVQDSSVALSRPVVVSGSGTLDGTGTSSSSVTVNAGGNITNGDGTTQTLSIGALTLNSGGSASPVISGSPLSPGIITSGVLATDGNGVRQITLNVSAPAASLSAGTYDVIKYGSFTGTTADFALGTVVGISARQTATITTDAVNSALAISVTGAAGNLTWRGTNSSNWSTGTTNNWLNGLNPDNFYNGDKATFDDTVGSGPTTINIDPAGVVVGSVTFANSSAKPYTLNGGTLNGAGGAVMAITSGGTVTLNTTYTGNVNLSSGTLLVGSGGTVGALSGSSTIANKGTVAFNRSNTATQGTDFGTISGTGTLIQNGVGTLILAGANTYTGTTNIASGTLQIGNGGTTGSLSPSSSILNNGTLIYNRSNTAAQGTDFGTISGAGPVIQNGVGATILSSANSYTGGTTLNAGTMVAGNNGALGSGMIKLTGGALGSSTTVTLANSLNASSNSVIGWASQSGDITLNGALTGNATLSNYLGSGNNYNVYFKGNLSGFTGTLNYTCDANAATGWWRFGSNGTTTDLSNAVLNINAGNVTNLATVADKNAGFTDNISGSTLKLGALSGDGVFQSSFNNAGPNSLQVGFLNTSSGFTGVIAGGNAGTNMSLTKVGNGTLTLGGSNLYTGGTNVQGGTLLLTNTSGSADNGTINLSGGTTFQVNIGTNANFGYNPTINLLGNATISNGAAGGIGSGNGQINFTGTLNGNGNTLNISSPSLARWYMNATVNNLSKINVVSGAMGFDLSVGNHGGSASVNVSNGAALWIANSTNILTNSLTLNGTGIAGLGALYQEGGGNPIINSPITLSGNTGIGGNTGGANVVLNGVISGPGMALTMVGYNSYALAAAETYTGPTTISSGTLQLGNGGTTGSISPANAVADNGTFAFNRSNTLTQGTDFGTINGNGGVVVAGSGTVAFTAANTYTGTTFVQTGTLNVSGGIASPSSDVAAGYGAGGNGVLNVLSGGTVQGNEIWAGESGSSASAVTGVINVYSGGTISASAWLDTGRTGTTGSSGTLNVTGGTVNVKTSAASGNLEVGVFDSASGTVNINSGAVNLQNNANIILGSAGTTGNGTINQLGGTVIFYSNGGTTVGGTGVLTLGASNSSGVYTYNLAGGTLTVPSINKTTSSTAAQGIFNFNGGTLRPTASNTNFINGLTAANVLTGGAKIDTNGFNVTVGQQLVGSTADGGLTKIGDGVLTLTSSETYTGSTTISAGTLRLAPLPLTAVADYTFDHLSGSTVVNDGTGGSSMNGTLSGATIVSGGQTGNAASFNGNASINISNAVTDLSNTAVWTVNAWVKTTTAGASILSKDNTGSDWGNGNTVFYLGNGTGPGSGGIPSAVRYAGGFYQGAGTATAVNDNAWHQITYVDNAGTYSLYVDGVAQALSSGNSGFANGDVGSTIRLGYSIDSVGSDGAVNLKGLLDNVQIYNQALNASQVQSLAQGLGFGTLPTTTDVSIASGATLDITGTNQQIASLNGAAGSFVTLGSGSLAINTSGSKTFSGVISGTGSIIMTGTGTQTLSGNDTYTGTTTVTGGKLNLGANQNTTGILVRNSSGISINNGQLIVGSAVNRANRDLLVIGGSGLTIGITGTLDLGANDLDLQNPGATGLSSIVNQLRTGFNNGTWTGHGIISSAASNDSTHLTALGVIQNNQSGIALFTAANRFDGIAPNAGDVLLKYTYFGDSNLDGKVDSSDYARIDNGYLSSVTGWFNGDFNYDGIVNGSDYTLIDNAFNTQGAQLTSQVAAITAQVASVPEPTLGSVAILASLALLGRRRNSRLTIERGVNL